MCMSASSGAPSYSTCAVQPLQQPAMAGQPDVKSGTLPGGGLLGAVACGAAAQRLWLDPPPDAQRFGLLTDETLLHHAPHGRAGVA